MIDKLEKDHDDILSMYQLNLARAEEASLDVTDDESAGKIGDIKKKLKTSMSMLEAARKAEKAPYMAKAGIVQAFFASRIEKLEKYWEKLDAPHAKFLKEKEDRARREREDKARRDAEEAAAKLKVAQEAERIAREEKEAAQREAQRIAAEAEKARKEREAEAERVRKAAEAEAEAARAAAARAAAEAAAKIAALEKEKADAEAKRQSEILQAEEGRKAQERRIKEIGAEKKALEKQAASHVRQGQKEAEAVMAEANRDARALEREGRAEIRAAESAISDLNKEVRQFEQDADHSLDAAVRADRIAARSEKATMEKGSVLSRTRGDTSLSSVAERWVGSPISREEAFKSAALLWEHIPFAAIEQAVQAAVTAGARQIPGCIITQETKTVNR